MDETRRKAAKQLLVELLDGLDAFDRRLQAAKEPPKPEEQRAAFDRWLAVTYQSLVSEHIVREMMWDAWREGVRVAFESRPA